MRDLSDRMKLVGMEITSGRMGNLMRVVGQRIKWMDAASFSGKMERNTMETS